jgi:MT0933-like antitoxin protein
MSAFDNLKNKAAELAEDAKEHLETASDAIIDKAGDAVDAVTGGKFSDKVDDVQARADDVVGGNSTTTEA